MELTESTVVVDEEEEEAVSALGHEDEDRVREESVILFGNCEVLRFEGAAWEQGGGRLETVHHLQAQLYLSKSHLLVTFTENEETSEVSIRVPIPRVLINPESPVNAKASDDHIEVKLVLLLPVDHP
ncbi:hypothetical protein NC651_017777 [Populus alba x Populus x berolinensis]|nr:hypothetical protein NC651_017777 [Populus alba x Populus x berolinensis]